MRVKDRRLFLFVHFAEVDQKGHKHGENSQEYGGALASGERGTDILNSDENVRPGRILLWGRNDRVGRKPSV